MNLQPYSKVSTPIPSLQPYTPPAAGGTATDAVNTPGGGTGVGTVGGGTPGTFSTASENVGINQSADKPLTIFSSLSQFEKTLSRLVESISKFKPDAKLATELTIADKQLSESIEELTEHQNAAKTISQLQEMSKQLDDRLKNLLLTLAECRRDLRAQPSPNRIDEKPDFTLSKTKVSAKDLLQYASKITKFTSAPPDYNPLQPEHANFPWPSEDELRKGMMAYATVNDVFPDIQPEEQPKDTTTSVANATASTTETKTISTADRRRSSIVSYGERTVIQPVAPVPGSPSLPVIGLDFFDPDEDEIMDED